MPKERFYLISFFFFFFGKCIYNLRDFWFVFNAIIFIIIPVFDSNNVEWTACLHRLICMIPNIIRSISI